MIRLDFKQKEYLKRKILNIKVKSYFILGNKYVSLKDIIWKGEELTFCTKQLKGLSYIWNKNDNRGYEEKHYGMIIKLIK